MLAADREDRPQSAQAVLDELRDIERKADLELLIARGETASLEFKQTMRWDVNLQKRNPDLLRACMKTVSAFLNSGGGTLMIGVANTGQPTGLEDDLKDFSDNKTVDGFELKFRDAVSKSLDPDPNQLVTLSFPYVNGIPALATSRRLEPRSRRAWRRIRPVSTASLRAVLASGSCGVMVAAIAAGLKLCRRSWRAASTRSTSAVL